VFVFASAGWRCPPDGSDSPGGGDSMIAFEPLAANPYSGLVAGAWYCAIVFSGAEFLFWLPRPATRTEARDAAYAFIGPEFYERGDIDSVRRVKGIPV